MSYYYFEFNPIFCNVSMYIGAQLSVQLAREHVFYEIFHQQ